MIHVPSDSLWNCIKWSKKDHFCMILFKISAFFLVDSLRSSLMCEVKSLKTTNFEHMWATEKKSSYFPLSWLVNRDPYIGLSKSLYNRVALSPIYPNQPGVFHCPCVGVLRFGHLTLLLWPHGTHATHVRTCGTRQKNGRSFFETNIGEMWTTMRFFFDASNHPIPTWLNKQVENTPRKFNIPPEKLPSQ